MRNIIVIVLFLFVFSSCSLFSDKDSENKNFIFKEDFTENTGKILLKDTVFCNEKIENGFLVLNALKENFSLGTNSFEIKFNTDSNFCVETSLKLSSANIDGGLAFRFGNFGGFSFLKFNNDSVRIEKEINSDIICLSKIEKKISPNAFINIKIIKKENRLLFFIDSTFIYSKIFNNPDVNICDFYYCYTNKGFMEVDYLYVYRNFNFAEVEPKDKIVVNKTSATLEEGTFYYALHNIKDGGVITFEKDMVFNTNIQYEFGEKSVTIDGTGKKIIFNGNSPSGYEKITKPGFAFQIYGNNKISLKNLTFINCASKQTGAAICTNSNQLFVESCMFIRNISFEGGAVNSFGNVVFKDCTFMNNIASDDGGAFTGEAEFENCFFINNSADDTDISDIFRCDADSIEQAMAAEIKKYTNEAKNLSEEEQHNMGEALSDAEFWSVRAPGGGGINGTGNAKLKHCILWNTELIGCYSNIENSLSNKHYDFKGIKPIIISEYPFIKIPDSGNDSVWGTLDDNLILIYNDTIWKN